jgi:hypothetical protein
MRHENTADMLGAVIGGGYGLFVWIQALTGGLDQAGFFLPRDPDLFGFVLGVGGLAALFMTVWALIARHIVGRDIDLGDRQRLIVVASAGVGILMWVLTSGLHLPT